MSEALYVPLVAGTVVGDWLPGIHHCSLGKAEAPCKLDHITSIEYVPYTPEREGKTRTFEGSL